jgi:hypothetical protein
MSLMALLMHTVLASFPNKALSFIRVAICFLQENVTISENDAEGSCCHELGETTI